MPGFNRRGPMGQGPMTGRGRGFCAQEVTRTPPENPPPDVVFGVGRGGIPWGCGRGRAFGGGRRGRFGRFF